MTVPTWTETQEQEHAAEIDRLREALQHAEATIRAMGEAAGDCRRAYDAWLQTEWERDHAQTKEQ